MFGNAQSYDRFMGRWSQLVAARLLDFVNVPKDRTLLDIGSGTGSLSFTILQRNAAARIVGIDPSQEFVAYANSKNPAPERMTFETGDAQHLRFPDATFGCSLSLFAFNFIPDPRGALREARRVTEAAGSIAAAVWDYGGQMQMLRTFWDAAASIDERAAALDERHMRLCRPGELSALWKNVGLVDVHEQPLDIEMHFDSFEDYWQPFLLGQGPAGAYATSLASHVRDQLRSELKKRLPLAGDHVPFTLAGRAWAVRGIV